MRSVRMFEFTTAFVLLFLLAVPNSQAACARIRWQGPCSSECGPGTRTTTHIPAPQNFNNSNDPTDPCTTNTYSTEACDGGGCALGQYCVLGRCAPHWAWGDLSKISSADPEDEQMVRMGTVFGSSLARDGSTWASVWVGSSSNELFLTYSTNDGESWVPVHPIMSFNGSGHFGLIQFPKIAVFNGTWVVVCFVQTQTFSPPAVITLTEEIQVIVSSNLTTWSPPIVLSQLLANDAVKLWEGTSITASSSGFLIAYAFSNRTGGLTPAYFQFNFSSSVDGSTWTDRESTGIPPILSLNRGISMASEQNNVMIAFQATFQVFVYRSTDMGTTWNVTVVPKEPVVNSSTVEKMPSIATDGQGNWMLACTFSKNGSSSYSVGVRTFNSSSPNWSAIVEFPQRDLSNSMPTISAGENRTWVIVWAAVQQNFSDGLRLDGTKWAVHYAFSKYFGAPNSWSDPRMLSEATHADGLYTDSFPTIGFNADTALFRSVWISSTGVNNTVLSASLFIDSCDGISCMPRDGNGTYYVLPDYSAGVPSNFTGNLVVVRANKSVDTISVNGSLTFSGSVIVLGGVTVSGNLSIGDSSIIQIDNKTTINVTGCLNLHDAVLNISQSFQGKNIIDIYNPANTRCVTSSNLTLVDGRCAQANAGEKAFTITLVLFPCPSDVGTSLSSWQIGVITLVSVVVMAIVVVVIVLKVPKFRQALFPFRDRTRHDKSGAFEERIRTSASSGPTQRTSLRSSSSSSSSSASASSASASSARSTYVLLDEMEESTGGE